MLYRWTEELAKMEMNCSSILINDLSKHYKSVLKDNNNQPFFSLKNISLKINHGEHWGIIGKNGSGKSTLLSLIAGILKPSSGSITIRGSLSQILDVGGNFVPDLSGRENVTMLLSLYGIPKLNIQEKIEAAINFAEIGQYIDYPVKNYSNGMFLRLAFATSIQLESDIFLVDEVFSTGDATFREKIKRHFSEKIDQKLTLLLATHNADEILEFCDFCLWLEDGSLIMTGSAKDVIEAYYYQLGKEHSLETNAKQSTLFFEHNKQEYFGNKYENKFVKIENFSIGSNDKISYDAELKIEISIFKKIPDLSLHPQIVIFDYQLKPILTFFPDVESCTEHRIKQLKDYIGMINYTAILPKNILIYGHYYAELRFGKNVNLMKDFNEEAIRVSEKIFFEVIKNKNEYIGRTENVFIRPPSIWEININ